MTSCAPWNVSIDSPRSAMSSRTRRRQVVCISTSKPVESLTASAGGGSITVACPFTGSIVSSMRPSADMTGKLPIGASSVSLFPSSFDPSDSLALAFGSSAKKDDTYAILATLRRSSAVSPTLHWKCRVPEAQMPAGLLVSTCGNYIVGGGTSGNIYVWKSLGGVLLKIFKAHYRSVICLAWSSCGRLLVTGGADGVIHAFPLLSVVSIGSTESSVQPIRSFSHHHLPITAIKSLPGSRIASASQDGQISIVELCSNQCLASIQLPQPVTSMDATAHRLYAGTHAGTIYCIDLDLYAIHQTRQLGAIVVQRTKDSAGQQYSDRVLGLLADEPDDANETYRVELRGHDRPVTAVAVLFDYEDEWLVSGDQSGTVRVWDMASRACVRTIPLWSSTGAVAAGTPAKASNSSSMEHPVASITVLGDLADDASVGNVWRLSQMSQQDHPVGRSSASKNPHSIIHQIKPLQRFADESLFTAGLAVRINRPKQTLLQGAVDDDYDVQTAIRKRLKGASTTSLDETKEEEIRRLREELAAAKLALQQQSRRQ